MNTIQNSNIYGFDAASALRAFAPFVEGTPNGTLAVISHKPLPSEARAALASSAERLGFGRESIVWVVCEPASDMTLKASQLQELLVACDPLAFAITDAQAASQVQEALDTPCTIDAAGRAWGRNTVTFADFPAMLSTPEAKQKAWALLKKLT